MPDGAIEPNTEANRKTVDDYEKQIATQRAMIEKLKQAEVDGSRDRAMEQLKLELTRLKRTDVITTTQPNKGPESRSRSDSSTVSHSGRKPRKSK